MLRIKTVFVVGAGASKDIGLPLGDQLSSTIAAALDFRPSTAPDVTKELIRTGISVLTKRPGEFQGQTEALFKKSVQMSDGLRTVPSIDVFVDNHSHDPEIARVGKLAIAASLNRAEASSDLSLRPGDRLNLGKVDATWFVRLFNILAEGVKATAPQEVFANISFVIFNYDRCVEHFFQHAIATRFFLPLQAAEQIVREHCRVVHPYGSLGPLSGDGAVEFGQRLEPGTLGAGDAVVRMATNLRTFTESMAEDETRAARALVGEAKRIVFLGFGFQSQNAELLTDRGAPASITEFRSTVYTLSPSNKREVLHRIRRIANLAADPSYAEHLIDLKCGDFITAEQLFLSA